MSVDTEVRVGAVGHAYGRIDDQRTLRPGQTAAQRHRWHYEVNVGPGGTERSLSRSVLRVQLIGNQN